ncbi:MAG: methyltransferase [Planctomycetota bacterium]|jgi:SAM-dependent methyltransferase
MKNENLSIEKLNRMARAYMQSRPLLSALELDVFTAVGDGATAAEVAEETGASARGMEILLDALAALGLLDKKEGVFLNSPAVAELFDTRSPENQRSAFLHTVHQWERWHTLTDCVKTGTSVTFKKDMKDRDDDWAEIFISAMHSHGPGRAKAVADTLDLSGVKRALDIGGGPGDYCVALARKKPDLVATVFDLPNVIPIAKRFVSESEVSDRVEYMEGDMLETPFGENWDLIMLGSICHMWSPEQNVELLEKCRSSLRAGGQMVIIDFVLEDDRTAPAQAALFAINMLVSTQAGNAYTAAEYSDWLLKAGFEKAEFLDLEGNADLVVARKKD